MNALLQADPKWIWNQECTEAFCLAKQHLTSAKLLTYYDPTLPLTLAAGASAYGVGAVISHTYPDVSERPIAFASCTLSPSEKNYAQSLILRRVFLHLPLLDYSAGQFFCLHTSTSLSTRRPKPTAMLMDCRDFFCPQSINIWEKKTASSMSIKCRLSLSHLEKSSKRPDKTSSWGHHNRSTLEVAGSYHNVSHYCKAYHRRSTVCLCPFWLGSVFAHFGLPEQLVSDNGPQFTSEEFAQFMRDCGTKHILCSPYHPSSNGLAERFVQTFKRAMRACEKDEPSLHLHLSEFLFSYRSTPHATTAITPAPSELFLQCHYARNSIC